jgi:hypothetical protein
MNLIEAISKLDARLLRDEQGHEIKGPYWVNRNDVIELLLAAQAPKPLWSKPINAGTAQQIDGKWVSGAPDARANREEGTK